MPQVYRISKGKKTSIFVTDAIWAKIQKKPNIFGKNKWELISKSELPVYKPPVVVGKSMKPIYTEKEYRFVDDDLAEKSMKPIYTEKEYRADLHSANLALKAADKKKALALYKRAIKFKKSVYVKTKIKELS